MRSTVQNKFVIKEQKTRVLAGTIRLPFNLIGQDNAPISIQERQNVQPLVRVPGKMYCRKEAKLEDITLLRQDLNAMKILLGSYKKRKDLAHSSQISFYALYIKKMEQAVDKLIKTKEIDAKDYQKSCFKLQPHISPQLVHCSSLFELGCKIDSRWRQQIIEDLHENH